MSTKKRIVILIAVVIVIIVLCSYFRSIIDNQPFINSLDSILISIISSFWQFVSNPTIFITLSIIIFLWFTREKISTWLLAITEIQAGSFSAKIDSSKATLARNVIYSNQTQKISSEDISGEPAAIENQPSKSGTQVQYSPPHVGIWLSGTRYS